MDHQKRLQRIIVVITCILTLVGLDLAAEPARPAGLPADAFWLGGPDGGVFVLLQRQDRPALTAYRGTIYHQDGSLWYKGPLLLKPARSTPLDVTNRKQFAGWDGTQLLLQDGRALVAKPRKTKQPSHGLRKAP